MNTTLPTSLDEVVRGLLRRHPTAITLDELADAIGDRAVTPPQIAEMMRRLEAEGRVVEQTEVMDLSSMLRDVLAAARDLQRGGRTPTIQTIAARLDVRTTAVHAALLFSRTFTDPA